MSAVRSGDVIERMSLGEQVVEAVGAYIEAKIDYARARRSVGGEYANARDVERTATELQELIDRVGLRS